MCSSVADNLKAGARLKPELFLEASVYFSDIEDFSSFVSELSPLQRLFSLTSSCICSSVRDNDVHELSPLQIVDLLGRLWIMFDDVIAKHNVYKVSVPYVVQMSHTHRDVATSQPYLSLYGTSIRLLLDNLEQ